MLNLNKYAKKKAKETLEKMFRNLQGEEKLNHFSLMLAPNKELPDRAELILLEDSEKVVSIKLINYKEYPFKDILQILQSITFRMMGE